MRKDVATARDIAEVVGPPPVNVRRHKHLGPLHDLLLRACPPDVYGNVSIPVLARQIGMTSQGVQKWMAHNRVPPRKAKLIVSLQAARKDVKAKDRVTLADFSTWVFG